jgi:hypothetical protein
VNLQNTLDLDYEDPPVPRDLLDRARRRGRLVRRRRRIGAAAGAVAVVAGLALGVQSLQTGDTGTRAVTPAGGTPAGATGAARTAGKELTNLPEAIGKGPTAQHFTSDGYAPDEQSRGRENGPPAGAVTVLAPAVGKLQEQLMWITKDAVLVWGYRENAKSAPRVTLGLPLNNLPAQGLWGNTVYSDGTTAGSGAGVARTFIAGLVRGPVTKVVIDLPGGPVSAHLVPTPDPELGTLYWVATDVFDSGGGVVSEAADPAFGKDVNSLKRTVYRGEAPVFHCERSCVGGM